MSIVTTHYVENGDGYEVQTSPIEKYRVWISDPDGNVLEEYEEESTEHDTVYRASQKAYDYKNEALDALHDREEDEADEDEPEQAGCG